MSIDFSSISAGSRSDRVLEPKRIFTALPQKDPKYDYVRDVQGHVWDKWFPMRDKRDLVIKMNTGSGKTMVGLLMLKSSLNEKKGPAVYLAPDPYLASQVQNEAEALGLKYTNDPRNQTFRSGKAILITTIKVLINGISKFGVGVVQIPIGTLLIDDAHACLAYMEEQFTLSIKKPDEGSGSTYETLRTLFAEDLRRQSYPSFEDLLKGDPAPVIEVPYWAWQARHETVFKLLYKLSDSDEYKFVWPLIADCLPACRAAITAHEFSISPPLPNIDRIPSLIQANRRIYLTATLSDDGILVTHFGADPITIAEPITPNSADDMGDRLILTPLDTYADVDEEMVRDFLAEQGEHRNVVVIVPSWRRAKFWEPVARDIYDKDSIYDGVDRLRRQPTVGLVVLVNKYDGIDLPGKACEILVIDQLPEAYQPLARVEARALQESRAMVARQIQRIEQGMGRGVRSNKDYCVVVLLGAKLVDRLHMGISSNRFGAATQAQLDLSMEVADRLSGHPFSSMHQVINSCLSRDPGWLTASRNALDGVNYPRPSPVSPLAVAQRRAFDKATVGQFGTAASTLQDAINSLSDRTLRGWAMQQLAAYRNFVDQVGADATLHSALEYNRAVTKPRDPVQYKALPKTLEQGALAVNRLALYARPNALIRGVDAVLEDLVPAPDDSEAANRFEQAWRDLGEHVGFRAERPEQETGNGPDVLWAMGELKYLVVECKSGSIATSIRRDDAEQLSHSIDWFRERYDGSCIVTPLMIHNSRKMAPDASARQGMRVITFASLERLRDAVRSFVNAIAHDGNFLDKKVVAERLVAASLNGPAFINAWANPTQSSV